MLWKVNFLMTLIINANGIMTWFLKRYMCSLHLNRNLIFIQINDSYEFKLINDAIINKNLCVSLYFYLIYYWKSKHFLKNISFQDYWYVIFLLDFFEVDCIPLCESLFLIFEILNLKMNLKILNILYIYFDFISNTSKKLKQFVSQHFHSDNTYFIHKIAKF